MEIIGSRYRRGLGGRENLGQTIRLARITFYGNPIFRHDGKTSIPSCANLRSAMISHYARSLMGRGEAGRPRKGTWGRDCTKDSTSCRLRRECELYRHKNAEQMTTQGWLGLYWARMNEAGDYEIRVVTREGRSALGDRWHLPEGGLRGTLRENQSSRVTKAAACRGA